MVVSAEYHGMDYVIAAYEGMLQQQRRAQQQAHDAMIQQHTPSADSRQDIFECEFLG